MVTEDLRWYVINTFAGAEWQSHQGLLRKGLESFYPHYIADARRGRWYQGAVRPHFPGYLFAGLEPKQSAEKVTSTAGVREIIKNASEFVKIPPEAIARLKEQALANYNRSLGEKRVDAQFFPGDWVTVPYGPLCGKPAQIQSIDKSGYIRASLGSLVATFHLDAIASSVREMAAQ